MDDPVERLLREQHGVARRSQLMALGYREGQLRAQLAARRWRALGSLLVATHNGPLDRHQQCWAAVLSAGRRALLAGLTALEAAGLRGWGSPDVHVVMQRGSSRARVDGIRLVLHETRRPLVAGSGRRGFPPGTRVEVAAVQAASWRRDPRTGVALLAAVVQQRLTTATRLKAALGDAGPIRNLRALRLAAGDIEGGAEALSEIDFVRLCRRYQLGRVVSQRVRLDGQGRRRYLDGDIEGPSGKRVAFEVDGGVHLIAKNYWQDMHRQNELLIASTPLLRFSSYGVRFEEALVADQIRRATEP